MPDDYTTIRIKNTTKNCIEQLGKKGETWDELLTRLILEKTK